MAYQHIVCGNCLSTNRIPDERLGDHPVCGKCRKELIGDHPEVFTVQNFDKIIAGTTIPVVVDCWATWCQPCKMVAPIFAQVAAQLQTSVRFGKVDTDAEPRLADQLQIQGVPTFIVFSGGREIARRSGGMNAAAMAEWIRTTIASA